MRTSATVAAAILGLTAVAAACGFFTDPAQNCAFDGDISTGIQGQLRQWLFVSDSAAVGTRSDIKVVLRSFDSSAICLATIAWTLGANSGTVSAAETTTDSGGYSETSWRLGNVPGTQTLTATVVDADPQLSTTFVRTAVPGPHLEIVSGDGQSGPAGSLLALRVHVVDAWGFRISQVALTWQVTGGGALATDTTTTTILGSENTWTLGPAGQNQRVTVSEAGGSSVTFSATVTTSGPHPRALISAYNGTSAAVTVTAQTPFDGQRVFGPIAPSTQVSDSLQVEPQVSFDITATLGAVTGSVTCTTTAAIVPNPSDPTNTGSALVSVFTDGTGGLTLTCFGGWVGLVNVGPAGLQAGRRRLPAATL